MHILAKAMGDEPFLLVSLDEEKSKTLAQVLSNDTARKILDHLSKADKATETEISKQLKVPLSTVHYNLDLLVKADLISDENFTYSEKGKEVVHYALSNKYVIIAPKRADFLKEKLRQFLPVALIMTGISVSIKYFWNPAASMIARSPIIEEAAYDAAASAEMKMMQAPADALPAVAQGQDFAVWFLFGSIFALLLYFVWAEVILKKIKKN